MGLVSFALKNPFTILAIALGLSLLSLAIVPSIPVDILPDFKTPMVVTFYSYPGMPTAEMEKSVAESIERLLTLAGGMEHQESRSVPGASVLKVGFHPGTKASAAMNDVVNLENNGLFQLPPGIEYPFTLPSEPGNLPVVLAAISGEGLSEKDLYQVAYYGVRNKMGGMKGVQVYHPFGGKYRQMMVYVDPGRLRSVGLSPKDVSDALQKANLVLAAGTVKIDATEYQVHALNTLADPDDIANTPVAVRDGRPIFVRDIGYVKDDAAIQYNIVRVNGQRSVYVPLLREPGENTVAVVDRIREAVRTRIPEMKERGEIPEAAQVTLLSDQSLYIRNAMRNLSEEVGVGAILVTIVVFVFLRRLLPTLAIVIVIFLSLTVGGLGFYFTGNTINVMTLGGLSLAVGTTVDVGIVVVESIMRHMRMGKSPHDAARDGTAEVAMPALAGTFTTLIVYIPVIFLTGMIKYLFTPLSVAATMTIGASYFVGMTVVPIFCARFVRSHLLHAADHAAEETLPPRDGLYARLLQSAMRQRKKLIVVMAVVFAASLLFWLGIGSELFPMVDAGTLEIRMKTIPGTRLEETEKIVARVEETVRKVIPKEELVTLISNIGLPVGKGAGFSTILSPNSGSDSAFLIVNLSEHGRKCSTESYTAQLRERLARDFPQEQFLFVGGGIVNAALNEGSPVPINIQVAASSLEKSRATAEQIVNLVKGIPGAIDVQIAQALDYPQLDIKVDRARAKFLGLDQREVAQTILTALASSLGYAPTVWIDPKTGIDFFMGVQYRDNELKSLDELRNVPVSVTGPEGPVTIPLSNIATIQRVNIPGEIKHYNISQVYDVYVNVAGRDVGSVAAGVDRVLKQIPQKGVTLTVRGPVATMKSSAKMLGAGILVATVLMYLVLMAQFRSFLDPLIIVLAVPLGISGVLATLCLTGTTLNIQSMIGTLMMIGVAIHNSILLVEFANRLQEQGYEIPEAALAAAQVRLRPILMTAFVLAASMLPMAFHFAPGGEAMIPLARAVIGGMLVSTFLTLFLVPCVYTLLKRPRAAALPEPA